MSANTRRITDSPLPQGADEIVAYLVTIPTTWGTAPLTGLVAKLYQDPDGTNTDVSATKLSGSATATGQVITTPLVTGLTAGVVYRLEVKFVTAEANTLEFWGTINGER